MSVTVVVTDDQTGESETLHVADDDYYLLTVGKCYVDGIQTYPARGTHVITVKGQRAHRADAGAKPA